METIQAYVNNLFGTFPQTNDVLQAKQRTLTTMLDQYNKLKEKGFSENQAVGKVISEFGNANELMEELHITSVEQPQTPFMNLEQVKSYLSLTKKTSLLVAIGVFLCILGAVAVCLFDGLAETKKLTVLLDNDGDSMLAYISLFVLIAVAVALFIYSGFLSKQYDYIKKGISLDSSTKQYLIQKQKEQQHGYMISTIVGVVLCILSPLGYFASSQLLKNDGSLPAVPFLLIVSVAVFVLVLFGCRNEPFKYLLAELPKTQLERKTHNLTTGINSVIMMAATGIFFISGFCFNHWESAAVIFLVGGVLCGITSTIIETISNK